MVDTVDAGGTAYDIQNHTREQVEFDYWKGRAGVRRDGDTFEFAYIGDAPRKSPVNDAGKIGNVAVKLTSLERSKGVPSMMVGTARVV